MAPTQKKAANAVSKTSAFVLIGFVSATLIIFGLFRIFNHGRFIHMNVEISLLAAYICILWDPEPGSAPCRSISMCLHFFFTVAFAFFTLEAVYMYSLLSHVVTKNGMMSNIGNFLVGWGSGICVLAFCVSFEFDEYGGLYHCWLQMDSSLMLGVYIPIVVMFIIIIMLIEAAGSVDDTNMPKLPGRSKSYVIWSILWIVTTFADTDDVQITSAKYMHKSLILRAGVCFVAFVVGTMAIYGQSFGLYFVFTVLTGILGGFIFFFHCMCNDSVKLHHDGNWTRLRYIWSFFRSGTCWRRHGRHVVPTKKRRMSKKWILTRLTVKNRKKTTTIMIQKAKTMISK